MSNPEVPRGRAADADFPPGPESRMLRLVHSFPSLRGYQGPWEAVGFESWASGPWATHGSAHAARFVLHVWNGDTEWKRLGRFNLRHAIGTWDEAHRNAFLAWCRNPFLP